MAKYDYFISHSTKDKDIAYRIVDAIESTGHTCWIAPRNIPYGTAYASAIMEGIEECDTFIVLISEDSIKSDGVLNEVDNAHASKKRIIPVRLTDTKLSRELNFYLSRTQWLVLPSNTPESIIRLLDLEEDSAKKRQHTSESPQTNGKKNNIPILLIAALCVILCFGGILWWFTNGKTNEKAEENLAIEDKGSSMDTSKDTLSYNKNIMTQIPSSRIESSKTTKTETSVSSTKKEGTSSKDIDYEDMIFNADSYYNEGKFEKAFPLYVDIANNYDVNYARKVGYMYEYGKGIKEDRAEARKWYVKAADYGNPEAKTDAAYLLLRSNKYKEAAHYYLEAEKQIKLSPQGKNDLGYLYFNGLGVAKDTIKAKKYWTEAANEGHPNAKANLDKFFHD